MSLHGQLGFITRWVSSQDQDHGQSTLVCEGFMWLLSPLESCLRHRACSETWLSGEHGGRRQGQTDAHLLVHLQVDIVVVRGRLGWENIKLLTRPRQGLPFGDQYGSPQTSHCFLDFRGCARGDGPMK